MEIYSSINNSLALPLQDQIARNLNIYDQLNQEYVKCGFTYKSNQILHKIGNRGSNDYPYPYLLLIHVSKLFHLNQFQIIFYSHILNQQTPCYNEQVQIFQPQDHVFPPQTQNILNEIYQQGINQLSAKRHERASENILQSKDQMKEVDYEYENYEDQVLQYTFPELKKIALYLMVIGYAVKYYLNEQSKIKPYEEHMKRVLPNFFSHVFNKWAKKYGNKVLNTTPRKINSFYMSLGFLQGDDQNNEQKENDDCQYRNYNQIVQQLLRATSQGQQQNVLVGDMIKKQEYDQNHIQQGLLNGNNNHHNSSHNNQQRQYE